MLLNLWEVVQAILRIGFRGSIDRVLERKIGRTNIIISRELIAVHYREVERVIDFMLHDLEDQLFVVYGIEVMADYTGAEGLFPKGSNHKWIHIETGAKGFGKGSASLVYEIMPWTYHSFLEANL